MYNFFVSGRAAHVNASGDGQWTRRAKRPWDISERGYAKRVAGSAVRMLAGQSYGLTCLQFGGECSHSSPPDLALALHRLRTHFAFVGITDDWALSICLFHAMFGGACLAHEFINNHLTDNHSRTFSTTTAAAKPLGGIVDLHDGALFEQALQRFKTDLSKWRVTPERCASELCPAASEHFV